MVNFKKVVAILCSATMIVAAPITAFAEDPAPTDPAAGTTGGTGNIVAYSFETITVPTAVKVSFNPQGWDFTLRGTGADATKSDSQIVSLNYGISSMATMNRKVTVSFAAEGTAGAGEGEVVFVDSEEKVAPKTDDNPDGASFGEYKLYLAVAPADAAVVKGYDTDASAVDFKVDSDHKSTVTSALLSDVDMKPATKGIQAFVPGDDSTETSIAYKLDKATYELKADSVLNFDTTSANMKDLVQPQALGSTVGFTFVGAMNENADWTKAALSAIKITPTYEVADADGTEEVLDNTEGYGYNQLETEPAAPTAPSVSANTVAVGGSVDITLPEGVTITAIQKTKADGSYNAVPEEFYTLEDITGGKKLTIAENYLATYAAGTTVKIVFSEGDPITITVTAQ